MALNPWQFNKRSRFPVFPVKPDNTVYTWAGPEISVASTKAYTTQLVAGLLFAVYLGQINGKMDPAFRRRNPLRC